MPYRLSKTDPLVDGRWDALVRSHPQSTVYHTSYWQRVLAATFRFRPAHIGIEDASSGELCGILPGFWLPGLPFRRRYVSLPLATYCGPLFSDSSAPAMHGLPEPFAHFLASHPALIKCRNRVPQLDEMLIADTGYVNHRLDMRRGPEALLRGFHPTCIQRTIRKALNTSVEVAIDLRGDALGDLYGLYLDNRRKLGLPPVPRSFFRNLFRYGGDDLTPMIVVARKGGALLAAGLFLRYRDSCHFEIGASPDQHRPTGAGTLMMWSAIQKSLEMGCRWFDFGRTAATNPGLATYKARWGAEAFPLYYYSSRTSGEGKKEGLVRMVGDLNRKLPAALLRLEGELVYRFHG